VKGDRYQHRIVGPVAPPRGSGSARRSIAWVSLSIPDGCTHGISARTWTAPPENMMRGRPAEVWLNTSPTWQRLPTQRGMQGAAPAATAGAYGPVPLW
jgi:hypothetical protein